MKDVEQYKKENEQLRQENANLNKSLKQLNASYVALKQGHDFFVNDGLQLRTYLVTEQQEKAEGLEREKKLTEKLAEYEARTKNLTEELSKSQSAVVTDDLVGEKAA
jgi:chromosome segregation ATPase